MRNRRMPRLYVITLPLMLLAVSGCGILYTNVHAPRAYRSATPADVESHPDDPIVSGEACNRSILYLFAWGNGGYSPASREALKGQPPGSVLYDVKSDMSANSYVLGLYTQVCTIVTGKVSTPK